MAGILDYLSRGGIKTPREHIMDALRQGASDWAFAACEAWGFDYIHMLEEWQIANAPKSDGERYIRAYFAAATARIGGVGGL